MAASDFLINDPAITSSPYLYYSYLMAANSYQQHQNEKLEKASRRGCGGRLWKNPALYKTALCDYFITGQTCKFGTRCWYAHGEDELRYVPRLDQMQPADAVREALIRAQLAIPQAYGVPAMRHPLYPNHMMSAYLAANPQLTNAALASSAYATHAATNAAMFSGFNGSLPHGGMNSFELSPTNTSGASSSPLSQAEKVAHGTIIDGSDTPRKKKDITSFAPYLDTTEKTNIWLKEKLSQIPSFQPTTQSKKHVPMSAHKIHRHQRIN